MQSLIAQFPKTSSFLLGFVQKRTFLKTTQNSTFQKTTTTNSAQTTVVVVDCESTFSFQFDNRCVCLCRNTKFIAVSHFYIDCKVLSVLMTNMIGPYEHQGWNNVFIRSVVWLIRLVNTNLRVVILPADIRLSIHLLFSLFTGRLKPLPAVIDYGFELRLRQTFR